MALMLVHLKLDDYITSSRSILMFRVDYSLNLYNVATTQLVQYNIIQLVRQNMYIEKPQDLKIGGIFLWQCIICKYSKNIQINLSLTIMNVHPGYHITFYFILTIYSYGVL